VTVGDGRPLHRCRDVIGTRVVAIRAAAVASADTNASLKGNCADQLEGTGSNEGTSDAVNLFVESPSAYKINKSIVHSAKATKGLGVAGFTGVDGAGEPVLEFKTKTTAVRLTGGLDAATLLVLAKGIQKNLK
jgi:hypothetical protein